MKKKKFNLLLNIATLCLCVAAIAFGVYSAKNASLNVSGTIGFNAHNCKVAVKANLSGDGVVTNEKNEIVSSENGNVRRTALEKEATFTTDANGTIDFGSLYFADMDTVNGKAAPIKMTFTITNNSAFAIKASVTLPKNNNDVIVLANKDSIKIEQGTNKTGEITLTFTLNNPEASLTTALDLSTIKFDFTKFEFKKSDIEVIYTETALKEDTDLPSNYYINYGQGIINTTPNITKYDIKWFIIGTYGKDGQINSLNPTADFTKTLSTTENTGKILNNNITYAFWSGYILTSDGLGMYETKWIPFNNNMFYDTTDKKYYSNEYTSVPANDYSISTVRAYLNGKTINANADTNTSNIWKPSTDTTTNRNFFAQNTLKGNTETNEINDIYTLIQPRTLSDMYKEMSFDDSEGFADVELPTAVEGIAETDGLPSIKDMNNIGSILGLIPVRNDDKSSYFMTDGWVGLRSPCSGTTGDFWWSPMMDGIDVANVTNAIGVRPAFLI